MRRKALYQKDEAQKKFEDFSKKLRGEDQLQETQNLTLKLDILKR